MKYLIMIYSNPMSRKAWEGLSDAQRVELGLGQRALTEALAESGWPIRRWASASRYETVGR